MTFIKNLSLLFILLFSTSVWAAPQLLNYQGTLLDNGTPVNGIKEMSFKIYENETGGTYLWNSGNIQVPVVNGVFSVPLNGENPANAFPDNLFTKDKLYVATIVDGSELTERKRLASVPYALNIPKGVIVMWSGSEDDIPLGWALCNGENGTPNLRDRFIVGAGKSYEVDTTGGINKNNFAMKSAGEHYHKTPWGFDKWANYGWAEAGGAPIYGSHVVTGASGRLKHESINVVNSDMRLAYTESINGHTHQIYEETNPDSSSVENRPLYYALCFIIKL